jgi:hypothetical protein
MRKQLDELDENIHRGECFLQPTQPAQGIDPRHLSLQQCERFGSFSGRVHDLGEETFGVGELLSRHGQDGVAE